MMLIKQFPEITPTDTLFVFALEAEAGNVFAEVNTVFTGIGKVNAAIALTKAIAQRKPKLIVNLGSAGSQRYKKGEVVCCTRFVQRDMVAITLGHAAHAQQGGMKFFAHHGDWGSITKLTPWRSKPRDS